MGSRRVVAVDVYSDVVCPWCYIGKRRLERAIALHPELEVKVRYRAYELHPDLPPQGEDARTFYGRKYGGTKQAAATLARVTSLGEVEGIRLDFSRLKMAANSLLAHRALQLCHEYGAQPQAVAAIFAGVFEEGIDVGRLETLMALLRNRRVPLDYPLLASRLTEGDGLTEVRADQAAAAELGVDAVPFLMADDRIGLRGAAAISDFEEILTTAAARPIASQKRWDKHLQASLKSSSML
jgi:predicted DsbA family dithiol-disulfide isomerase